VVSWDPSLSVGDAELDAQHVELFRRVDALVAAMAAGGDADIAPRFDAVDEYVREHFGAQERLMEATAFPGTYIHRAAHERFIRDYQDLRKLYEENGATHGIAVKARTWLEGWLKTHIARLDHGLARHVRAGTG
jgi:hemerythrin